MDGDAVPLRDQLDDLHPEIGEGVAKRADPAPHRVRELAFHERVDG